MGLYRNEQGGFACLALLKILYFFIGVTDHIVETRLSRGDRYRQQRRNTINAMHNMMHGPDMAICCGLGYNATSSKLNGVGLNQRFKFKLHM